MTMSELYNPDKYDRCLPLLIPAFELAREVLASQIHALGEELKSASNSEIAILDIGCGSGFSSIPLLASFKNLYIEAVDSDRRMLESYRRRAQQLLTDARVLANVVDLACLEPISNKADQSRLFDLCLLFFVVNNFSNEIREKILLHALLMLKPGGCLIVWDIFGFQSLEMQSTMLSNEIDLISKNFDREIELATEDEALELMEEKIKWVQHYKEDNFYPPVAFPSDDNGLRLIQYHTDSTEVLFRHGLQVILMFRKRR